MIWPEFEDKEGMLIPEKTQVLSSGVARMWIVNSEMIEKVHKGRMKIGTKGYFMEGGRKVAEAQIIRLVRLSDNET